MFQKRKIKFISKQSKEILHPVPIKKAVPEWYKHMSNYGSQQSDKVFRPTVKKCVPFLDALLCGYALLNPIETLFWREGPEIKWQVHPNLNLDNTNLGFSTHGDEQVSKSQVMHDEEIHPFKWLNPWIIKTPKNYSCLFTNPLNRGSEGQPMRIIDGIVDTDDYDLEINLPFFLKKIQPNQSMIIPKGYPVALVFPFPRESWQMSVEEEVKNPSSRLSFYSNLEDLYKRSFWKRKKYD